MVDDEIFRDSDKNDKKDDQHSSYTAEYSLGEELYKIFTELIKRKIEFAVASMSKEENALRPYYIFLFQLYILTKVAGMYPIIQMDYKKRFNEITEELNTFEITRQNNEDDVLFPDELLNKLIKIDEDLHETMQRMGLGINLRKNISKKKLLKKALIG